MLSNQIRTSSRDRRCRRASDGVDKGRNWLDFAGIPGHAYGNFERTAIRTLRLWGTSPSPGGDFTSFSYPPGLKGSGDAHPIKRSEKRLRSSRYLLPKWPYVTILVEPQVLARKRAVIHTTYCQRNPNFRKAHERPK